MDQRPQNEMSVAFPSTEAFRSVGRVAVGGLAVRLSIDISAAEELRAAADAAVEKLCGTGRISLMAQWGDVDLVVRLENPDVNLQSDDHIEANLLDEQSAVEIVVEPPHRIFLRIVRDTPSSDEEE